MLKRPSSSRRSVALAAALLTAAPPAFADPPTPAPPAAPPVAPAPAPPPVAPPATPPVAPAAPPPAAAPPAALPAPVPASPASPATRAPAPPAAAAPTAPVVLGTGAAWTRVHIVTQVPKVVLERRQGSLPTDRPLPSLSVYAADPVWDAVCPAPCDVAVQLGGEYRIGGENVTTSGGFALHGPTTELLVDAGSYPVRRAGVWLTIIGALAAAAGGIFLGVNAVPKNGQSANLLSPGGIASIVALAGGGTIGIVGIGLIVGGGTSVRDEGRRDLARLSPPSALHATFLF